MVAVVVVVVVAVAWLLEVLIAGSLSAARHSLQRGCDVGSRHTINQGETKERERESDL